MELIFEFPDRLPADADATGLTTVTPTAVTDYTANGAIRRFQRHGLKDDGVYGKIDNLDIELDGNSRLVPPFSRHSKQGSRGSFECGGGVPPPFPGDKSPSRTGTAAGRRHIKVAAEWLKKSSMLLCKFFGKKIKVCR